MANTKQKPVQEGPKRSPGKSKFSFPKKEVPPVDGSYLDRLFADYEKQSKELEATTGRASAAESPQPPITEHTEAATQDSPVPIANTTQAGTDSQRVSNVSTVPSPKKESFSVNRDAPAARSSLNISNSLDTGLQRPASDLITDEATRTLPDLSVGDAILLDKLKKKHRLGKGEFNVLKAMLRMCRNAGVGYCYIKIPQLMVDSNLKERQTQLVLRSLRELGLIEKLADYSNADRLGTKYRIIFDSF